MAISDSSSFETKRMLDLAARAAWRAVGDVEPGVLVGAVIVRAGVVIGIGHHKKFGGLHAERGALADCAQRREDPRGATMYVTLEPCGAAGKQPACVNAVIEAGIARVVCARRDPHPVKGGGAEKLRAAGVVVEFTDASPKAVAISEPFIKRQTTALPWVVAKWAQTLDGKMATRTGESKWISGPASRRSVHRLRSRVDAVITGIGTVLADDPMLTARGVARIRRRAARVVVDTELRTPDGAAVVRTAHEAVTIVVCAQDVLDSDLGALRSRQLREAGVRVIGVRRAAGPRGGVDLEEMLRALRADFAVSTALLESGPRLLGAMIDRGLVDEAIVYVAPVVLGDNEAMGAVGGRSAPKLADGVRWELAHHSRTGEDLRLVYRKA